MHVDFAFDKSTRQKYRICGILRPADARTHVPERENRLFFQKSAVRDHFSRLHPMRFRAIPRWLRDNDEMQKIDFHYNVPNRLSYAALVARTVHKRGLSLALWSSDRERLKRLDDLLWRFDDLAFLPHAEAGSPLAAETPIVWSTDLSKLSGDVLLLLDDHLPPAWKDDFERFTRIIDVVSTEPQELQLSRERYRAYRAAGVELAAYDRRH